MLSLRDKEELKTITEMQTLKSIKLLLSDAIDFLVLVNSITLTKL
jgi:hypothetical protein